ncbi:MAG TPA: CPBP family intramembrane glutamic endopeptidase [Acidimicrobiales bacterium]|nr:CPBP family intramembrane glutamic endopeptidase [Acidimicrobiales bacterium]
MGTDDGEGGETAVPPVTEPAAAPSDVASVPPVPSDPGVRWGLGDAAAGALVGFFASGLLAGLWVAVTGNDAESMGTLAAGQIGLWIGLLGAALVASRTRGSGSLAADFGLRGRPRDAVGLAVGVACQLVVIPVLYLLVELLTGDLDVEAPARELADRARGAGFVVLALCVVIGAPVVEEIFFRGLVLRAAERRWGTGWALAVSSLAFAAFHFQPPQFPGLALVGLVFGLLVVRTGRLGPGIAAHVAFNATAVVSLVLTR